MVLYIGYLCKIALAVRSLTSNVFFFFILMNQLFLPCTYSRIDFWVVIICFTDADAKLVSDILVPATHCD